ncbi:MAG: PIG-L deacetylase family protein [Planctomycetota bacterium]
MTSPAFAHRFPPLLPKEALSGPVVVLAAHPDDEVIAAGGMLAWHASVGHRVVVVHATDGAQGDPSGRFGDIVARRREEGREALARLGVTEIRRLGLPDGELPEHRDALISGLAAILTEIAPKTLYGFFFTESHRDHRAVAWAAADLADRLDPATRCLLFGVNQPVPGGTMFDIGDFVEQKQRALSAFESQLAYNDWRDKIRHRAHSMTVNIEDPAIVYAEVFADLRPSQIRGVREHAHKMIEAMLGGGA